MPSDAPAIAFRPIAPADRGLLKVWLSAPHVRPWWGDPDEELALIYDTSGEHEPFIAEVSGEAVAYAQAWRPPLHPDLPWQHGLAPDTRGIDITIGRADNCGRGLGPLILKHFAARLFAEGARRLIIDPSLSNRRAISACLKAGFTPCEEVHDAQGGSLLMELLKDDMIYGN